MSAVPLPSGKGEYEPAPLEGYTKDYKEVKQAEENQEPVENMQLVMQWINTIEATDEQNITESDVLASIDTASTSSTNYYGQEAFKHFQPRLFKLMTGIIPCEVNLSMVGRMKGGGNNRVAGIRLDWPAGEICKINDKVFFEPQGDDTEVKAVFRACRWPSPGKTDPEIVDNYAILTELSRLGLNIPVVIAYDLTPWNSMSVPFMLLERLPGFRLEDIYGSLTVKQKRSMLLASSLSSSTSSTLSRAPVKRTFQPDIPKDFKFVALDFITGRQHRLPVKPSRFVYTVMRMFNNWITIIKNGGIFTGNSEPMQKVYLHLFEELRDILEVMKLRSFLRGQPKETLRCIIRISSPASSLELPAVDPTIWISKSKVLSIRMKRFIFPKSFVAAHVLGSGSLPDLRSPISPPGKNTMETLTSFLAVALTSALTQMCERSRLRMTNSLARLSETLCTKLKTAGSVGCGSLPFKEFISAMNMMSIASRDSLRTINDPKANRYVKISPELAKQIRKHVVRSSELR
ncbi:uncharacterized protein DFL_000596 [Arthrobotrys flagrans]|uniref:Aminoglycoside phosphotransferase domain-containing protein n=1 Tax=Arthrobotrys flagrans TaxID=97331 RepID=A0A437AED1_ARTFL|nr:hypothetical protein DFL_000596 [Arthrobotrys flagrans]